MPPELPCAAAAFPPLPLERVTLVTFAEAFRNDGPSSSASSS